MFNPWTLIKVFIHTIIAISSVIIVVGIASAYSRFESVGHDIDYHWYYRHPYAFVDKFVNDISIIGFGVALFSIAFSLQITIAALMFSIDLAFTNPSNPKDVSRILSKYGKS